MTRQHQNYIIKSSRRGSDVHWGFYYERLLFVFFFSRERMFLNGPFGYLWAFVDGRKLVARRPHPGLTLESFFFLSLSFSFFLLFQSTTFCALRLFTSCGRSCWPLCYLGKNSSHFDLWNGLPTPNQPTTPFWLFNWKALENGWF